MAETMPERIWLDSTSPHRPYVTQGPLTERPEYIGYVLASTHTRALEALREAREALKAVRRGIDVARKARRYTTAGEADDLAIIDAALSRIDAILKEDTVHD